MKQNMGTADRLVRILLALIVGAMYLANQISGLTAIVLGVFALVFLLTGFMSFCPLYAIFNLSTKKKTE